MKSNTLPSLVLVSITAMILTGCSTNSFSSHYHATTPMVKAAKPLSERSVTGVSKPALVHANGSYDLRNAIPARNLQTQQHYTNLGAYGFRGGRPVTPEDLARMTAKIGGDYYYHTYWHVGTGSGTEMVITGFTTPSTITSTSQTAAYGNYAGNYQNNSGVWGTVNGNANAYGYGSSQTTVGGSSTYQAVPYQFPIFENFVIVLASPQRTQQLIQQGALTQVAIDQYCLEARIKRGEAPAVIK